MGRISLHANSGENGMPAQMGPIVHTDTHLEEDTGRVGRTCVPKDLQHHGGCDSAWVATIVFGRDGTRYARVQSLVLHIPCSILCWWRIHRVDRPRAATVIDGRAHCNFYESWQLQFLWELAIKWKLRPALTGRQDLALDPYALVCEVASEPGRSGRLGQWNATFATNSWRRALWPTI